jgi:hypothetical protein
MIRSTLFALSLALFPGAISAAPSALSATVAAYDVAEGTIESIDLTANEIVVKVGERTKTIKITKDTTYTLDGVASTRDAVLKTGSKVKVEHKEGTASVVDARTK